MIRGHYKNRRFELVLKKHCQQQTLGRKFVGNPSKMFSLLFCCNSTDSLF